MNTTSSPLRRDRTPAFVPLPTAGFSLVELIGVIILIGIISAGAFIYVGNAGQQARLNTKLRNAQMLNQLVSIAAATGATIGPGGNIDTTSAPLAASAITSLNNGFTVGGNGTPANPGILIKMNPSIATPTSYIMTVTGTAPNINVTFSSDLSGDTLP